jgi:hypothetical protein
MILGRDVLRAFGIKIDFENDAIIANGVSKPMRPFPQGKDGLLAVDVLLQDYLDDMDPVLEKDVLEDGFAEILESKYDKVTPKQIASKCTHLSPEQQKDLAKLFKKFEKLFDGNLHKFTDKKIHLEIDSNVSPLRSRAYPVPHRQRDLFKKELDRLVAIGVLEKSG